MIHKIEDIYNLIKSRPGKKMVLVNGIDEHSLEAAYLASEMGLITVQVTGSSEEIRRICRKMGINYDMFDIVEAENEEQAALQAVRLVSSGHADFMMKGLISTDKYMRALLNKEFGMFQKEGVLSHVTLVENDQYPKLLLVSDVAVIPYPNMAQKEAMINYLISMAKSLGVNEPKVALIAPTEQVLPAMPACTDSALLTEMGRQGNFPGGIVDGPMALDVAIDTESARIKNIVSPVAGNADCLLFHNIDAGNVFYKMSTKLCHSRQAAVVVGAKVPAVLSSRGDDSQTKLNSIVLASFLSKMDYERVSHIGH